jgi:hypothetical protein
MATKRNPGAVRGRPRKGPAIVRGGKPGPMPLPFLEDPQRYEVAKFYACLISMKKTAADYTRC